MRYQEHIAVNASATLHTSKAYQPLAHRGKVADLRIEDSQNLPNANYSDLPLLWQPAVKDAQRRNGINGGDPRSGEEAVYAGFAYP